MLYNGEFLGLSKSQHFSFPFHAFYAVPTETVAKRGAKAKRSKEIASSISCDTSLLTVYKYTSHLLTKRADDDAPLWRNFRL